MKILNNITDYAKKHALFEHGSRIIIGLSGGPDSVFLFHYLLSQQHTYSFTLIAAHLNHEWRPEADQEEKFCHELAESHGVTFVAGRMSQLKSQVKYDGSKEAFARTMRRHFLESVCHDHNADVIALAHHEQDQQETFFIRLLRGATLTGLTAMQPKTNLYIRPLLTTSKTTILNYLHAHALPYMVDQSNESPAFLRNRIRTNVIPALRTCDQRFDTSFANTLTRLQETEDFLEQLTHTTYNACVTTRASEVWLNLATLHAQHPVLQQRVLMHWLCQEHVPFPITYNFLQEIIRFLHSPKGGSHSMHITWHIVKKKGHARIVSNK